MTVTLYILIFLAFLFDLLNGMQDSSNMVATVISSRALRPSFARVLIAIAEFMGPFLFGTAVAHTIGSEIVDPSILNINVLFAALISAILWNVVAWLLGFPTSSSHAIIGGLIGATVFYVGWNVIHLAGVIKVFVSLLLSPLVGFLAGFILTKLVYWLAQESRPSINWFFKRGQVVTSATLALSYGGNDAQKTMGLITMALVATRIQSTFVVPTWVKLICAIAIALGTVVGNWRLIRKLGGKFYKIRPVNGFNAQAASAAVVIGASLLGGPVSTTQVVSSSIMGVGASERWGKVRWNTAGEIALAWLVTIPVNILLANGISWLISQFH
jgi:inorganic phosphate transporter, PiT family